MDSLIEMGMRGFRLTESEFTRAYPLQTQKCRDTGGVAALRMRTREGVWFHDIVPVCLPTSFR